MRALFMGETKKEADGALAERADRQGGAEPSITDRYLDVMFMTYRAGNGLPDSARARLVRHLHHLLL